MNFVTSRKMIRITKFKTKKKNILIDDPIDLKMISLQKFLFFSLTQKNSNFHFIFEMCYVYLYSARMRGFILYYLIFFFIWCLERQPFCIGEKGDPPPLVGNLFFPLGGRFSCHFDCRRERTRPKLSRLPLFKSTPQ